MQRPLLKVPGGKKPAPEVQIYIRSGGRFPVALDLSGLAVTGAASSRQNMLASPLLFANDSVNVDKCIVPCDDLGI